jgi:predicted DNA-binding protein
MKFVGVRLPLGMISDINYIKKATGVTKSMLVRQGLAIVINDYFQKEKVKQEQTQDRRKREASIQSEGGLTLPDGW